MASPFFLNELFWSLIGLIGVGIAIIFEMRKNRGYLKDYPIYLVIQYKLQ